MNITIIKFICSKFGFNTQFVNSSALNIKTSKEERLLDICNELGGSIYYSGLGAKAYQDENNFIERGIKLQYIEYRPFEYSQLWGDFYANVSVLDYLMNSGYNWMQVIQNQKRHS